MAQRIGKNAKAEDYGFNSGSDGTQNAKALIKAISEN